MSELFEDNKLTMRRVGKDDVARIREATSAEGQECLAPTHVFERGEKVVGYGSAGRMAIIAGWMSKTETDETAKEALRAMERVTGWTEADIICIPCTEDCRFKPFLEQQGYTEGSKQVTLYFKKAR